MCCTTMFGIGLAYCNGGVCLRAFSTLKPVGPHSSGAGEARVVIKAVGVMLRCRRIHNMWSYSMVCRGRCTGVIAPYIPCIPPREFMRVGVHNKDISPGRPGVVFSLVQ
jgi:hypothetical protein